jgi:hypothetical protein
MTSPRHWTRAAPLLLLAGLLSTAPAAGQPRRPAGDILWSETEVFRGLLRFRGVSPITSDDIGTRHNYEDVIVVILGPSVPGRVDAAGYARRALANGGAVLIAMEDPANLAPYFPAPSASDARVTGEVVVAKDRTTPCYGGKLFCPFVAPTPQPRIALGDLNFVLDDSPHWSLFAGLDRVAVNTSGALAVEKPNRYVETVVARFPQGCLAQRGGLAARDLPADRAFALAGSGNAKNPFRCLVLADPSVFSNQMLLTSAPPQGEQDRSVAATHNLQFADRVVNYLRGPLNRTQCLFIENGTVRNSFDDVNIAALQSPPLPIPPPPNPLDPEVQRKTTDFINRSIADWQANDGPNRAAAGPAPEYHKFTKAVQFLAAITAVLLLIALIRRAWRGRHEPDVPPVPTDTGRVAGSGPPGSLARRREEILQAGDYTDVVRDYLRDLFVSRGLPTSVPESARTMPEVVVRGPGNTTLREYLRILWGVVHGQNPRPVTYTRWKELEPMIDAVRRAAEDGRWRFAESGGTA